ncbi:hypothetical protein V6N11_049937 [Hibiscus sabdariffa]|uniref:Uncharacterized protein n=1 Tax=Hibiscus sabdariffa TaxID=183260 RepID=A0ABR2T8C3_9ROSI
MRTDTSKGFRLLENSRNQKRTDTGYEYRNTLCSTDTPLSVPIRRPKANGPQRLYAYRYRDKRTGTLCTRSADLAAKSTSTAPKHPQRSPTASRWPAKVQGGEPGSSVVAGRTCWTGSGSARWVEPG